MISRAEVEQRPLNYLYIGNKSTVIYIYFFIFGWQINLVRAYDWHSCLQTRTFGLLIRQQISWTSSIVYNDVTKSIFSFISEIWSYLQWSIFNFILIYLNKNVTFSLVSEIRSQLNLIVSMVTLMWWISLQFHTSFRQGSWCWKASTLWEICLKFLKKKREKKEMNITGEMELFSYGRKWKFHRQL